MDKGEYLLERVSTVPTTLDKAWAFFSDPRNLAFITPPEMDFQIRTKLEPGEFYEGMIIEYTVKPFGNIPVRWVSEICEIVDKERFVDAQRKGPYKKWVHRHEFSEGEGGVHMRDVVIYAMPYGILGRLMHWLIVRRQLERIFDFRSQKIRFLFQ